MNIAGGGLLPFAISACGYACVYATEKSERKSKESKAYAVNLMAGVLYLGYGLVMHLSSVRGCAGLLPGFR